MVAVDGRDTQRKPWRPRFAPRLLVKEFDHYRTVQVDYDGGLRHQHLERIDGTPDRLGKFVRAAVMPVARPAPARAE